MDIDDEVLCLLPRRVPQHGGQVITCNGMVRRGDTGRYTCSRCARRFSPADRAWLARHAYTALGSVA